ncbi:BamA/TamA family outer membrane protein [uncultured Sunxiuqinia sp.]|uniref:translocation and assembly module lipoprotein TamL n=1 Tax=uncultured Sunxiuqinia sp. TaxID=1573825 RepID=UPI002AA7CCBB|nr:BamA/TamA family outer membrane protein [uncultured Sunxiuqinia sp.]
MTLNYSHYLDGKMRKEKLFLFLIELLITVSFFSCSSTKFVPDDKYLLNDTDVEIDNRSINKEELRTQIRQKENLKILGFLKFHLGLYNLSSEKKGEGWFKRIGEAPVIYDEFMMERSKEQLKLYLKNKGYYDAEVSSSVRYKGKKQKVNVTYHIEPGIPYRIRNYTYQIQDKNIESLILRDTTDQLIGGGNIFDVDVLNNERTRIANHLKNFGYYYFSENYITYLADTSLTGNPKLVDLLIEIADNDLEDEVDSIQPHKKYRVESYLITPDFVPVPIGDSKEATYQDTLVDPPYTFLYRDKLKHKPDLFYNINRIEDDPYYSLSNVEKTYRSLVQLRQFRVVNLSFEEVDTLVSDTVGILKSNFQLTALPRQGFSIDLEGTNSSGNLGIAGNLNYQHRNLFRGAEIFNLNLKGAVERQQRSGDDGNLDFNTREFGLEGSLTLPKFLNPIKRGRLFSYQVPQTIFSLGFNYQRRPDYTRTITNLKYGYNWKSSPIRSHFLNLLDFNFVNLYEFDDDFIKKIRDLYIKSSFTDHLISALNYTQINNNQNLKRRADYSYMKWSFESAGNLLSAYSNLLNRTKETSVDTIFGVETSYHEMLGVRYAQYLKGDFEYRYGHMVDDYNAIVGRAFIGVAMPYGNFDVLPFEKKYFSGGANGIRAWQVRSLGPGTYDAPSDAYPNQSGDIKLEANLEYRYRFVWRIEGAFFLDAGNIWAINKKDNRPGAQFYFDSFYKQIAVGTGMGLRFDFTYFIFRLDLGMKLRDPSLQAGKRSIIGNYPISAEHFNLTFAIGYPF